MARKPPKYVCGVPTFYGVYEDKKQEVMEYGNRGWNADTIRQYDSLVLTHIVPYLQDHDRKHIAVFSKKDYDDAILKLRKRGKNAPGEPFEPWEENGIPEKAYYLMKAVVWTASNHLYCENVFGLREIHRDGGIGERKTGEHQARTRKSLTVKQEIKIYMYLMSCMNQAGSGAGLMLMYALGLRNNEACGINFGYIREFLEYPGHYYLIVPQTTELGSNALKIMGKTANSGRRIPLPNLLLNCLFRLKDIRAREAMEKGFSGNPDDLPIACKKNNPLERCSSDDISRAAKEMYERIGMRSEDLIFLNQELMEDTQVARDEMEEDEFREIEKDPTAYLLRRNFATHMAILGLTDQEIRYVIGHQIEDEYIQRRAFGDEKLLFRIKQKMDERPLLNSIQPECSISLKSDSWVPIGGSKKILINLPAEQLTSIRVTATAREPGDQIRLRIVNELGSEPLEGNIMNCSETIHSDPQRTINGIRFYQSKYMKE